MAENNSEDVFGGMFNLKGVMDAFYNYQPGPDDETGAAIKNTFASNMIQSAFDQQMAMQMGEFQAGIGTQNMQTAADLELRNNSSLMEQEFGAGMASMGAQFDYQNQFANAQYDRDVGMLGATGEQTRKTQDNEAFNQRQNTIVSGEQQRLNTALQGGIDIDKTNIAADATKYQADSSKEASMYGAQQSAEASKYGADKSSEASMYGSNKAAEASMYGAKQSADASKYGADSSKEASMYGSDKAAQASMYGADKNLEGVKDTNTTSTKNIQVTGDESRKSAAQANQFSVDKENRQQARSRAGARRY